MTRLIKWLLLPAVVIAGLATVAPNRGEAQVYYNGYGYPGYYSYRPFYRSYYRFPYYGYYRAPIVTVPGPIYTVPPPVQALRVPMYVPTPYYVAPNYQVYEY